MTTNFADRIESWTSYMYFKDGRRIYFSGRTIKAGGKEYAIIADKHGRISRGVDRAYVEAFSTRSQPAQALEREFQARLEGGSITEEIMMREMADG